MNSALRSCPASAIFGSRGAGACVNSSGSIACEVPDEQIGNIMQALILPDSWQDKLLAKIHLADEVKRVEKERKKLTNRLQRLGLVYLDELMGYEEYKRQKRQLEGQLGSLVVPGVDAMNEAGRLLENLSELWQEAELGERRRILMTMLEAVYVECKEEKRIVAIKPKPAFRPLFEIATTRKSSNIALIAEPVNDATHDRSCSWWRRGRVKLYPEQRFEITLAA